MHTDMCSYLWKTENTMRVENGTVNQTDSHGILGFAKFKLKKGYWSQSDWINLEFCKDLKNTVRNIRNSCLCCSMNWALSILLTTSVVHLTRTAQQCYFTVGEGLGDQTDQRSLTSSSSSSSRFDDRRHLKPLHFCYPCYLNLKGFFIFYFITYSNLLLQTQATNTSSMRYLWRKCLWSKIKVMQQIVLLYLWLHLMLMTIS